MVMIKENIPHVKGLEFSIEYMRESVYLKHQLFDYDQSNALFMKMYPYEEYPLSLGSIF